MDALLPAMVANAVVAVGLMAIAFGVSALGRARAGHAAWLVVLLKLVTPPLVVIPIAWAAAKVVTEPHTSPPPPAVEPDRAIPLPALTADPNPEPVVELPAIEAAPPDVCPSVEPPPVRVEYAAAEPATESVDPWRVAFFVWLTGAAGWSGLVALRVVRFRRFVSSATPADVETFALARAVAARLGLRQVPAVSFVDGPVSPMLWAIFGRPRILLPRRLWAGFDPDHREAVLAHELAHLARGDHWVRRFELIVLALYWWCPVAWIAVRELRRAEEACCDARVLGAVPGRAAAYAEALVETIAFVNRPGWVPLASGGAVRASDLKRRVTMILNSNGSARSNAWLPAAVLLVGLAALPLAPGLADDPKPAPVLVAAEDPPPPPAEPPSIRWRVADEAPVRLWSNHAPQATPAAVPPMMPAPPMADNSRLKDELELLDAQMNVKQAHMRAAERGAKSSSTALDRIKKLAATGTVSQEEVAKAEEAYEKAISDLDIKKAEMQEHGVRMSQAKRRLEAGFTATAPARWTTTPSPASRPAAEAPRTTAPAPAPGRYTDLVPSRPTAPAPAPARYTDILPPGRNAAADPGARSRPAADRVDDDRRDAVKKRMLDMMEQYERTQRDIEKMQQQQADIKKMLDALMAEQKKLSGDLPPATRR